MKRVEIDDDDFRAEAVRKSYAILAQASMVKPESLDASLCLPVAGGRKVLRLHSIVSYALVILAFVVMGIACFLLGENSPTVTPRQYVGIAFCALGFGLLVTRGAWSAAVARILLSKRSGCLLGRSGGKRYWAEIEDLETVQVTKVETEDSGFCELDPAGRHLLVEGSVCRYIIRAEDVVSTNMRAQYAYSGMDIVYRIGDTELGLSVSLSAPGPLTFIVQAFAPSVNAKRFHRAVLDTLKIDR